MYDDELAKFLKRNIDNLHVAFKLNYYEQLIDWNRYMISHIRYLVSGHLLGILSNKNYYRILYKYHQVSVTIPRGKIEIDNFTVLLGVDDDNVADQSIHVFSCDIYNEQDLIFPFIVKIKYDDPSEISLLAIDSDLLYKELYVDNYKLEDLENIDKMRDEALSKNELLLTLADKLDELLDPDDVANIMSRTVYLVEQEGGDSDEEQEE